VSKIFIEESLKKKLKEKQEKQRLKGISLGARRPL